LLFWFLSPLLDFVVVRMGDNSQKTERNLNFSSLFFQSFAGDGSELENMFRRRDLLLVGICAAALSQFLVYPVLWSANPFYLFGYGSAFTLCMYFVLDYVLKDNKHYSSIPQEKQFYVLSNLIKAAVLMSLSASTTTAMFRIIVYDQWENTMVKNAGSIYSMCDFVSLFVVKRMSGSTIFHHVMVVIFNTWSMFNDYNDENICRAIVVYAVFSSFAYLVNFLLASRFLEIGFKRAFLLSIAAFVVYATCCLINWTWQTFYLAHLWAIKPDWYDRAWVGIFTFCISFVIYDDLVLLKWLLVNSGKMYTRLGEHNKEEEKKEE